MKVKVSPLGGAPSIEPHVSRMSALGNRTERYVSSSPGICGSIETISTASPLRVYVQISPTAYRGRSGIRDVDSPASPLINGVASLVRLPPGIAVGAPCSTDPGTSPSGRGYNDSPQ